MMDHVLEDNGNVSRQVDCNDNMDSESDRTTTTTTTTAARKSRVGHSAIKTSNGKKRQAQKRHPQNAAKHNEKPHLESSSSTQCNGYNEVLCNGHSDLQLNGFSQTLSQDSADERNVGVSNGFSPHYINGDLVPSRGKHIGNSRNNTLTVASDCAHSHSPLSVTNGIGSDGSLNGTKSASISSLTEYAVPDSNGDLHNRKFDLTKARTCQKNGIRYEDEESSMPGIVGEINISEVSGGTDNYSNGFSSDCGTECNSRSNNAEDLPVFSRVENEPTESCIDGSSKKTLYQINLSEKGREPVAAAVECIGGNIDDHSVATHSKYKPSDQSSNVVWPRNSENTVYTGEIQVPNQDIQVHNVTAADNSLTQEVDEYNIEHKNDIKNSVKNRVEPDPVNYACGILNDDQIDPTIRFDQQENVASDFLTDSCRDDGHEPEETQRTDFKIAEHDRVDEDTDSVSDSISQSTDCQSTCSTQSEWVVTRSWRFIHSSRNIISQADHVIDTKTTDLHSKFACISVPHAWSDAGQCLNDHSRLPVTSEPVVSVSERASLTQFSVTTCSSEKSSEQTVPSDAKSQDGLSDDLEFFYDDEFATGFDANMADIDVGMLHSGELQLCSSLSDVLSRSHVQQLGKFSKMKVKTDRFHSDSDFDLSRTSTACSSLLSVGSSNTHAGLDSTSSSENPKMLFISGEFDYSSPYLCEELLQTVDQMDSPGQPEDHRSSEMHYSQYDEYDISNLPYEHMFLLPHEATAASDTFSISDFEKEHFFSCKELMQSDELLDFPPHPPQEETDVQREEEIYDEGQAEYPSYVSSSGEFSDLGYSPLFSPSKESTGIAHVSTGSATTGSNASSLRDMINCDPYSTRQNYMLTFADGGSCSPTKQLHDSYIDAETSDASQHLTTWAERAKVFDEKGVETVKHFNSPISDKTSPGSGNSNHTYTFRGTNSTPSSGNSQSTTKPGFTTWAQQRLAKESGYLRAGLTSWKQLQEAQHARKMRNIGDWNKSKSMPDLAKHSYPAAPKSSAVEKNGEEKTSKQDGQDDGVEVVRRQSEHNKDDTKRFSGTLIEIFQRMKSNSESYNFSDDIHGSHLYSSYDIHPFSMSPPVPISNFHPRGDRNGMQRPGDVPAILKSCRATSMQTSPVHECWCRIHQMAQVQMSPTKRSFGMQFPPNVMDTSVQTSAHLMVSLHNDYIDHSQQTSLENKEGKGVYLIDTTVQTSADLEENRKLDRSLFFANRSLPDVSFLSKSSGSSISAMFRFSFSSDQKTFFCAPRVTVDEKTGKIYALIPKNSAAGKMFDAKAKGSASCILTQNLPVSKTNLSVNAISEICENKEGTNKTKPISPLALPTVTERSTKKNQVLQISPRISEGEAPSLSSSSSSGVESGSDYSQRSPRLFPEDHPPENRRLGAQTFSKSEEYLSKVSCGSRMGGGAAPKKPLRSCLRKKALLEKRKRSLSDPYGYSNVPYTALSESPSVCKETDCKCNLCLQRGERLNFSYPYKKSTSFDVKPTPGSLIDSGQAAYSVSEGSEEGGMGAGSLNMLQLSAAAKCVCIPQTDSSLPKSQSDSTAVKPKAECPVCGPLGEDGQEMTSKVKKTVSFANEVDFHSPSPSPAPTPFESPLSSPKKQNRLKLAIEHPLAKDLLPKQMTKIDDVQLQGEQRSVSPASDTESDSPPPCDFLPSPTFESPSSSVQSTDPVSDGEKEGHVCSDSDSDAGPPGEFRISPCTDNPPALPLVSTKKDLVMEVIKARDVILQHYSRAKDPVKKLQLLSTEDTPAVGHLVQDHLCRAIQHILSDGLKPELLSLFGKVKNTEWRVVEASTELGPSTKALHELVQRLETLNYLSTTQTKLDAFIFGLLNLRALGYWLKHLQTQEKGIAKHYLKDAFLFLSLSSEQQNFQDVITAVRPLSSLPFHLEYTAVYAEKHDSLPAVGSLKDTISSADSPKRVAAATSPKKNRPHSYPDNQADRKRRMHQEFRRSLSSSTESQQESQQHEFSSLPQDLDSPLFSSKEEQSSGWFRTLMTNSFGGLLGSKKSKKDKGMIRHNSDGLHVTNSPKRNLADSKRDLCENRQRGSLDDVKIDSEHSCNSASSLSVGSVKIGPCQSQNALLIHQTSEKANGKDDAISSEKSMTSSPGRVGNISNNKIDQKQCQRNSTKTAQKIIDNNELVTKEYDEKCGTEEIKVGFLRRITSKITSVTQKAAYKKGITEYSFDNQGNVVQSNCNKNNNNLDGSGTGTTVISRSESDENDEEDDGVDVYDGYVDDEGDSSGTIVNTTSSESPETPQTCKLPFACAESGRGHHKSHHSSTQPRVSELHSGYVEISSAVSSKDLNPSKSKFSWNKFGSGLIRAFDKVFLNDKDTRLTNTQLTRRRSRSETQVDVAIDSTEVELKSVLNRGASVPGIMPVVERRKPVDKSHSSERVSSGSDSIYHSAHGASSYNLSADSEAELETCEEYDDGHDSSLSSSSSGIENSGRRKNRGESLMKEIDEQEVRYVHALCDHFEEYDSFLSFEEDDFLELLEEMDPEWMICRLHQSVGLVNVKMVEKYTMLDIFMYLHGDFYTF